LQKKKIPFCLSLLKLNRSIHWTWHNKWTNYLSNSNNSWKMISILFVILLTSFWVVLKQNCLICVSNNQTKDCNRTNSRVIANLKVKALRDDSFHWFVARSRLETNRWYQVVPSTSMHNWLVIRKDKLSNRIQLFFLLFLFSVLKSSSY